ncbi:Putative inorganic phosphate cotransporter [Eumeta japonica]|uniref:Inorganic phosphate cotransporter n=1 Tax=Eumeta variegata TaxID=151549 RepID=A0A4C1ZKW5_EUMVA|nr:Putative inorganic phosphate cotransporter [Eumeta japonica]
MAPRYAGALMGITNCVANGIAIVAPIAAGLLLKDETNAADWRKVFYLSSGVYFVCNLIFVLLGSSERQPWNEPAHSEGPEQIKEVSVKQDTSI